MLENWTNNRNLDRMPVAFIGHGSPMGAIEPSPWTESWVELGKKLPRPKAILTISAHWLTRGGALVTASEAPRMNYDMYGFPRELYEIVYPAPGDVELAKEVAARLSPHLQVFPDTKWGFDHGTWVVLKYMFPQAEVPVIQLSIDYSRPPSFHYEIGKRLQFLRSQGVLVIGSGNLVHNLGMRPGTNNDKPFDWAVRFDETIDAYIESGNHAAVMDFQQLGSVASQAHPTYDHFLPVLYCLGLLMDGDAVHTFNADFQWPAVSMRSYLIG